MRSGVRAGILLLAVFGLAAHVSCDEPQSVEVLNGLPEMPGSKRMHKESGQEEKLSAQGTMALYEEAREVEAQDIIDFFVAQLRNDWCYRVTENYAYENGEFVDGKNLVVTFQGHGSTILLSTHQTFAGPQAYTIAIAPTYERDPDINNCNH